MNLRTSALLLALCSVPVMAGSVSVNISKMGGEGTAACSETQTDGTTAACHAIFTTGRGTAISSWYYYTQNSLTHYVWFGMIHRTVSSSSNITVWSHAQLSSEFTAITGTGHGVTVKWDGTPNDGDPITVSVDDGFGNWVAAGSVSPSAKTLSVPYNGVPIKILLEAKKDGVPSVFTEDYASQFHVDLSAY